MPQTQLLHGIRHPLRFLHIIFMRLANFNVAEAAAARTHIAQNHKGGRFAAPAFPDIRATGTFADSVQFFIGRDTAHLGITAVDTQPYLQPFRPAQPGILFYIFRIFFYRHLTTLLNWRPR